MENILLRTWENITSIVIPRIGIMDILEILVMAVGIYFIIIIIKDSKIKKMIEGLLVLLLFWGVASFLQFDVIVWLFMRVINVLIIAILIILAPELRKGFEQITGHIMVWKSNARGEGRVRRINETDTINAIVLATFELAKTKTGALIVIQNTDPLGDIERTGIPIDGLVTNQLLINIFEHNTPLHDGAVVICDDRVAAATCYLPLSQKTNISKELGTRHRAGVGASEVADCIVIIVSEETGKVSIAREGNLTRNVDGDLLRERLKAELDIKKIKDNENRKHMRHHKSGGEA